MCECASGLPFHYSEMTIFEPINFSLFGSFWILFFGTDLKSAHLFRRSCFPAFGFIQKSMSWPVCTVRASAEWCEALQTGAFAKWFAQFRGPQFGHPQNGLHAAKPYKCTLWPSAKWFADFARPQNGLHGSGVRRMVCMLQSLTNADFGRPQNGLHSWGVRRMVCTRWASADWFALRDSMRITSSPNLNRSCNENGCEKITKSAQIQSWHTNRISQKWLSFLPLINFDEFYFGVSSL